MYNFHLYCIIFQLPVNSIVLSWSWTELNLELLQPNFQLSSTVIFLNTYTHLMFQYLIQVSNVFGEKHGSSFDFLSLKECVGSLNWPCGSGRRWKWGKFMPTSMEKMTVFLNQKSSLWPFALVSFKTNNEEVCYLASSFLYTVFFYSQGYVYKLSLLSTQSRQWTFHQHLFYTELFSQITLTRK